MILDANGFAFFALIAWIPLSFAVFRSFRPALAAALLYVGAMLFLPERIGFDAPGVPPIDKRVIATLGVLLGAVSTARSRLTRARPGSGLEAGCFVLIGAGIVTALTNSSPIIAGPVVIPGLTLYEAVSGAARDLLAFGLPFFLGRALFRTSRDLRHLLVVLAVGGLVYTAFIVVEARLSPQWHRWIYGFHQHSFSQTIRFGGYRPMVFMIHGLAVSLFMVVALLATTTLARARLRVVSLPAWSLVPVVVFALLLCRSTGSWVYSLALLPVAALLQPKPITRVAVALSVLVLAYPALRAVDVFPTETLVETASAFNEERASSLHFRFVNEDRLVERALERPLFGWGGFQRGRVFDADSGKDRSTTDGAWIIWLGNRGLVGLFAALAMLVGPALVAARRLPRIRSSRDRSMVAGLALIVSLYAVDLLPNGVFTNLPYFLAGALAGLVTSLARAPRRASAASPDPALSTPQRDAALV